MLYENKFTTCTTYVEFDEIKSIKSTKFLLQYNNNE